MANLLKRSAAILLGLALVVPAAAVAQAAAAAGPAQAQAQARQINALIVQANSAMAARQWQQAADTLGALIALDPRWPYFADLGQALLNLGKYDEAIAALDKGLAAAAQDRSGPTGTVAAARAQMLMNKGAALIKSKRNEDAIAVYTEAARLSPSPATAYFNLCAIEYNLGSMDRALLSCNAAIKADPNKADAYFIKGSVMYGNGVLDKNNKYVVPAGTVEALRKYLQLAPDGSHVGDVNAMLDALKTL